MHSNNSSQTCVGALQTRMLMTDLRDYFSLPIGIVNLKTTGVDLSAAAFGQIPC